MNEEGYHPTGRRQTFSAQTVRQLLCRWGLSGVRRESVTLGRDEWWLSDLARHLQTSLATLRRWWHLGWMHGRQSPQQGYCILWADADEMERLCRLRDYGKTYPKTGYPAALTTPKAPADSAARPRRQDVRRGRNAGKVSSDNTLSPDHDGKNQSDNPLSLNDERPGGRERISPLRP